MKKIFRIVNFILVFSIFLILGKIFFDLYSFEQRNNYITLIGRFGYEENIGQNFLAFEIKKSFIKTQKVKTGDKIKVYFYERDIDLDEFSRSMSNFDIKLNLRKNSDGNFFIKDFYKDFSFLEKKDRSDFFEIAKNNNIINQSFVKDIYSKYEIESQKDFSYKESSKNPFENINPSSGSQIEDNYLQANITKTIEPAFAGSGSSEILSNQTGNFLNSSNPQGKTGEILQNPSQEKDFANPFPKIFEEQNNLGNSISQNTGNLTANYFPIEKTQENIKKLDFVKIIVEKKFSKKDIDDCIRSNTKPNSDYLFFKDIKKDSIYAGSVCIAFQKNILSQGKINQEIGNDFILITEGAKMISITFFENELKQYDFEKNKLQKIKNLSSKSKLFKSLELNNDWFMIYLVFLGEKGLIPDNFETIEKQMKYYDLENILKKIP